MTPRPIHHHSPFSLVFACSSFYSHRRMQTPDRANTVNDSGYNYSSVASVIAGINAHASSAPPPAASAAALLHNRCACFGVG